MINTKKNNEYLFEEGTAIPLSTVKVMCFNGRELETKQASHIYREKVRNIIKIKTARGRELNITGNHQLLGFDNGFSWKKAESMEVGDLITYPRQLNILKEENNLSEDDAYFLGFFVAEGTYNPFSVCNSDKKIIEWLVDYIKNKYNYNPTIKKDDRKENKVYTLLLRNIMRQNMSGLDVCDSSTKFVPEQIFNSSENIIRSFLAGYLEGDGEIAENILVSTTKSKKLAIQLTYLYLRLGISSSLNKRIIDNKEFYNVFVVGEDREKINDFPFKSKRADYQVVNSKYGYPRKIIDFLREVYKNSLGGCRGKTQKFIGKKNLNMSQAYRHLTRDFICKNINEKTFKEIKNIFIKGDFAMSNLLMLLNQELNTETLKIISKNLPFAFNSISEKLGLKKSSIRNYYLRNLPDEKKELIKNILFEEILKRKIMLTNALKIINNLENFCWDWIIDINVEEYDDYVYDFVVPDGHSFIGGNMPTIMHNTQLGLTLAVNVQLPKEQGGAEGKSVYIDTEGTFRPERIKQIAETKGLNSESVLKNILVARAFNSDHQILLIDKVSELIKNGEPVKIVIVDSLTAHFRAEFSGRGQLADRQQKLNRYLHNLMRLAEQFNLAVYVTNQVMANPAMMFGDPTQAIGGNIVGHACLSEDSLIQLSDGKIKEIKNMKQDRIISGDFNKMKFCNSNSDLVFVNPNVNKIYKIQTTNQIGCSPLHRFFTIGNFSFIEKEAKELKEGDFVAQAGRIKIEGEEQRLPLINVKKIGKISKENSEKIKEKMSEKNITREEICKKIGITPRQFRRVLNQSYPTSFCVLSNLQKSLSLQLEMMPVYTYKYKNLIIPSVMNQGLSQICGYFLGDGNFESRGLRFRDERAEILVCYRELFKSLFNVDAKISKMKTKNCFTLNINSKEVSDFFRLILPDILGIIAKSEDEIVKSFIKGFVDTEGSVDKKRARIDIAQKEKQILRYLQLFLLRFGIRSFLRSDVGKKKISVLSIRDRDVNNYLQIGFTARDKQEQLLKWIEKINKTYDKEMMPVKRKEVWNLLVDAGLKPTLFIKSRPDDYKWLNKKELKNAFEGLMNTKVNDRQIKQKIDFIFGLLNSDFRFEKIRKIDVENNVNGELFYDFSVPEKENYIANGFVVHNSTYRMYLRRGKKGSRVAKLIDSPNLPDNECVFFVTEAGVVDEVEKE